MNESLLGVVFCITPSELVNIWRGIRMIVGTLRKHRSVTCVIFRT